MVAVSAQEAPGGLLREEGVLVHPVRDAARRALREVPPPHLGRACTRRVGEAPKLGRGVRSRVDVSPKMHNVL